MRTGGLVAEAVSSAQEENQTAFAHASSPASPFPVRLLASHSSSYNLSFLVHTPGSTSSHSFYFTKSSQRPNERMGMIIT